MLFVFSLIFVHMLKISSLKKFIVKDEVGSWLTWLTPCLIFWTALLYIKKKKKNSSSKNGLMEPPPLKHKNWVIFDGRPPFSWHVSDGSLGFCCVHVPSIVFDNLYLSLPSPQFGACHCSVGFGSAKQITKSITVTEEASYIVVSWLFLHDITSASQKARMPSDAFEWKHGEWCQSWNITEFLCLSFLCVWFSGASLYTNFDELWMSVSNVWLALQGLSAHQLWCTVDVCFYCLIIVTGAAVCRRPLRRRSKKLATEGRNSAEKNQCE